MKRLLPLILWSLFFFPSFAQTPSSTPTVGESPVEEVIPSSLELSPSPSPSAAEPESETLTGPYATPRQSYETFMANMTLANPLRPDYYIMANRHLDLSSIPKMVREEKGATLSQQLFAVLSGAEVNLDSLDKATVDETVVLYRQPSGDQVEMKRTEDGRWLFTADTIKAIPRMFEVLSQKGKIERWQIEALNFEVFGLNGNLWVSLILLPLLAYGIACLCLMFMRIPLRPVLRNKMYLEDEEQKKLLRPFAWVIASFVAWIGLSLLDVPAGLLFALTVVVKILATVAVIFATFRASDVLSSFMLTITATTASKFDDMLIPLFRRTFKTLMTVIGLLFLAQNLDIEVWSLFAGFSIFGAMVALAGQDMVKNFFGSITVLMDRPFFVGDWIVVNSIEGVVEDVGFRSTRIRTFYDSVITLPNSQLITASVDNYGSRQFRRYTTKLAIRWNTPTDKVEAFCEGIRELVRKHPHTRKEKYQVWVNDMNEFSIQILVYIFFAAPDWDVELKERHRFLIDLHRLAKSLEIEFAYPSQSLFIARKEERFADDFDLEVEKQAHLRGRQATHSLLEQSQPKEP